MSNYHSTVTRRDFMKALGMGAVGLGTAAAATTTPGFRDLDEVISSPNGVLHMPWWVKDRERLNPTTEVDWNVQEPYDYRNMFDYGQAGTWDEGNDKVWHRANRRAKELYHLKNNTPGLTLRDLALVKGNVYMPPLPPYNTTTMPGTHWVGPPPDLLGQTPEAYGIPKWQGTPEENLRMMRSAARYYGASEVACVHLDENTEKLLFKYREQQNWSGEFVIEDVEKGYHEPGDQNTKKPGKFVIPRKCKNVLLWSVVMAPELCARGATKEGQTHGSNFGMAGIFGAYDRVNSIEPHIQKFIHTLGYEALGMGFDGSAPASAFATMGGLGEIGRVSFLVSPKYGSLVRTIVQTFTDLPLAESYPTDAGIAKFCETCHKCSDHCPSQALPSDKQSWEVTGPWNAHGAKTWHVDYSRCRPWKTGGGRLQADGTGDGPAADCGVCQDICVFAKGEDAHIHALTKGIVSATSMFNGFFTNMDRAFGYPDKDQESWWDMDLPLYGINSLL